MDFSVDYQQGFAHLSLPDLVRLKRTAQVLSAATVWDLHENDAASAVTNVHALLSIVDAWQEEPLTISQLVRAAMAHIALSAQWELLQSTNLSDGQLALLQEDWKKMNFIQPMVVTLEMERAMGVMYIENYRTSNELTGMTSSGYGSSSGGSSGDLWDALKELASGTRQRASTTLWRTSWSYDDELSLMQGEQILIETARQICTNGCFKNALADCNRRLKASRPSSKSIGWLRRNLDSYQVWATLGSSGEALEGTLSRMLKAQAARELALSAVALKRYQLRHGEYPAGLADSSPEFVSEIPRDPVDGNPLRYKLNGDGSLLLYSIGEDGKDDGGDARTSSSMHSGSLSWRFGRDWVWPQPVH